MKRIEGVVSSEPKHENGRILFWLNLQTDNYQLFCISASDYSERTTPKQGDRVILSGEFKADLTQGTTQEFYFSSVELQNGVN